MPVAMVWWMWWQVMARAVHHDGATMLLCARNTHHDGADVLQKNNTKGTSSAP